MQFPVSIELHRSRFLSFLLVLSHALEDDNAISRGEVIKNRAALENAKHVLETVLRKAVVSA